MQKRADGRYAYQLFLGYDENHKRLYKSFYGKTMKEARQKAEDFRRASEEDKTLYKTVKEKVTDDIEDKTTLSRIDYFHFGSVKIADINAADIESELKKLAKMNPSTGKPTSQRTLTRYLNSLNLVFDYAVRNRIISFNPCQFVKMPTGEKSKKRKALTSEDLDTIFDTDCRGMLAVKLMCYCGLRRGELTALTWQDINLQDKTINVYRSYDYKNNCFKSTKTENGIRLLPIPETLLNDLISAKKGKKKTDFVITTEREHIMMTEQAWHRLNEAVCKASGVNFTWHELRHTYATLLFNADVDVQTAKDLLGHADVSTTMGIYTHLQEEKKKLSIDKLNSYLDKKKDSQAPVT